MAGSIRTAILCAALLLPATSWAQGGPAQVGVNEVVSEPFIQSSPVLGRIVSKEEGVVAAKVAGPVAEMAVQVGDRVEKGDLLARLDMTRLEIERSMAEADVGAAQSELTTAHAQRELLAQEMRRLEQLRGSAAFSRARLDDKTQELIVAESRIASAQARLARAEVVSSYRQIDVDDGRLLAPYSGVVVRKLVSAGAFVRVGDPVVEMVNDSNVEIEADVPTELMGGLTPGEGVALQIGSAEIDARVRAAIPMENAMTRTQAVRFELIDGAPLGAIGGSVTVRVPTGEPRDVVSVHKDAVLVRQGGRMVFVVDKENTVVPRPIEIGASIGNRFEVTSGLAPGDRVVIRGNERLRPGQEVTFGERPPQSPGGKPTAGAPKGKGGAGRS